MNINLINYPYNCNKLSKMETGKRCVVSDNQPAACAPKDEIAFKGYNEFIKKVVSKKIVQKSEAEDIFFLLFERLIDSKYTRTEDFKKLEGLYQHRSLHNALKNLAGEKFSSEVDPLAEQLLKESQKQDLLLASCGGFPVLELHSNEMPNFLSRKLSLKPDNIVELKFNSELGGSSCIFGLNPCGELTLKQISNLALPKYTSFYNSTGKTKVCTIGSKEEGIFVRGYFNHNGSYNPFFSMLLR